MKRTALVCALILVATPAIAQRFWLVPAPHGGGPTALHFEDDITLGFGNTSAAPDCWFEWDTNATDDFELKCTDVDGGGTDGIIYSVDTGTNTLDVVGSIVAGTATIDAAAGTLTFTGATSATISTSTVDLTLSPGGGEVHVGADDSAKNVEIHSGGTFKMWDASDDTSITLDVDNGTTELDLTGSLAVSAALDVVGALSQDAETIADGDATPDVSGANLFVTSANTGATVITDLDSPTVGQVIALCGGSNTNSSTIADAGNFALNGAMTLSLDACLYLYVQADNDYVELGRNNVALTPWISNIDADTYDLQFTPGSGPADATLDERGLTCGARTTDSGNPAQAMVINSEDLYPFATQSSTAASNLILRGGLDAKQFGVLDGLAGCTGADYARAVYSVAGATATTTTCTYGTDWCSGVGADTCANATAAAVRLALCLDAGTGIGATASGAICPGGAANSRCVGVSADRLTASLTVSNNDDTCVVDGNGTDGTVTIPDGTGTAGGLCFTSEPGMCISRSGARTFGFASSGAQMAYISNLGFYHSGWVQVGNGLYISVHGGFNSGGADGKVAIIKNAGTAMVSFDATTANRLSIGKGDGTTLGETAELLLGSATITLNNAAAQTIYTVPAGFTLVPTKVVVRNPSAGTDAAVAGGWGGDANCTNYVAGAVFGAALGTTASAVTETPAINGTYLTYAAAVVFCYKLTVASTDADTVTMTLFGYLR